MLIVSLCSAVTGVFLFVHFGSKDGVHLCVLVGGGGGGESPRGPNIASACSEAVAQVIVLALLVGGSGCHGLALWTVH